MVCANCIRESDGIGVTTYKNDEDEKNIEKLLTNSEKSGIIQKLSDMRASGYKTSKKILKKVLNELDKIRKM